MGFLFDPERELQAATGYILQVKPNGPTQRLGTGFVISPHGLVVTAAHVVSDGTATGRLEFHIGEALRLPLTVLFAQSDFDSGVDFALCKVEASHRLPFAAISFARVCSGALMLRGYGLTMVDQSPANGEFIGVLDVSGKADNRLFQFSSEQAGEAGFSGSGVYAKREGGVVAIQTEAVKARSGPHQNTVLGYPLFRARKRIISAGVSFRTRVTWFWRRAVRATAYRPLHAASAVVVSAVAISMMYWSTLSYLTWRQLALMSTPEFIRLNSEETTFWNSAAGLDFLKRTHAEQPIKHQEAIFAFVEGNKMLHTVQQLNDYYEGMAACVIAGFCFQQKICDAVFDRIWAFYHFYYGVWAQIDFNTRQNIAEKSEYFLRHKCLDKLHTKCMSLRNADKICSG